MTNNTLANREKRKRFPDGFRIMQGKQEFITYVAHSSIRIWPSESACYYDPHYHSAVEIILVLQGEVSYTLEEQPYTMTEGQILIVPPNQLHDMGHDDHAKRYLFLFEPHILNNLRDISMLNEQLSVPLYLTEDMPLTREVRTLLMQIAEIYEQRQPMWNSMCYSLLVRLYALLGRHWIAEGVVTGAEESQSSIDSEIMNSVLSYINQHYAEDLGLDDAADFAGFSKYYFSRAFKKFFNISFSEYLCRRRLEAAIDLLTHTNLPIRQIATRAGFGSVATFNRIFRAAHACTPSRYRSLYGGL